MEERLKEKLKQEEKPIDDAKIKHALHGSILTSIGPISIIATELKVADKICDIGARLGIGRNDYKILTGIYAIGSPNEKSPVLVTANYKLTVDKLRMELSGLDLWLLIIDTKGVNVWCAAGKGTFSTEEIIYRMHKCKLKKLVNHNQIILPQLSAPGVSAYEITRITGFKVIYGPVYARDIKEFLKNNCQATEKMRRVSFDLMDRIAVSPIETISTAKYLLLIFVFFVLMQLMVGNGGGIVRVLEYGFMNTLPYATALIIGTILFPILLPILPFRMFSMKALILGVIWSGIVIKYSDVFHYSSSIMTQAGNSLLLTSIISCLGMNFTGSTTFTSLSGVKKETLLTVPVAGIAALTALILMVIEIFK